MNATTSFLAGVAAAAVPATVGDALGAEPVWAIRLVGVGLAVFAVSVAALAGAREPRLVGWVSWVSAADASWVVASTALIALGVFDAFGAVVVAAMGVVVATFAVAQLLERRRLEPKGSVGTC